MRFEGTVAIASTRPIVWDWLTDPQRLATVTPGVVGVEIIEPNRRFRTRSEVQLGSKVIEIYSDIEWADVEPLQSQTILSTSEYGGIANHVKSKFTLHDSLNNSDETKILFSAEVESKQSTIPQPMLKGMVERLIRQFFTNLKASIENNQTPLV